MPKTPGMKHRGAGRVAFLARVEEFKELHSKGYPLLSMYEKHEAELGISYSQFARYVAKYVRSPPAHEHVAAPPSASPAPTQAPAVSPRPNPGSKPDAAPAPAAPTANANAQQSNKPERPSRPKPFDHDPSAAKRDDLI